MLYAKSVQRYCFFLIQPSFLAKKCQNLQICIILVQIFRNSAFFCANLQVVRCMISTEPREEQVVELSSSKRCRIRSGVIDEERPD